MENGTPHDFQSLDIRFGAMEKDLAGLKAEITRLNSELARKDKIIAGLQKRLFDSSSEKIDPAQLQFELDHFLLGKPVPPPDPSSETSALKGGKSNAAKTRRTKADRFSKNLKILVESFTIPEQVLANPDDWDEISEEHHDELDVVKAEILWRRTMRKKFVHKADKALPPVIAPAPLPSIPGTLLVLALAARIITAKYQDHLPHYRQSQRFRRRHHIDTGRQTLNTWTPATARHLAPTSQSSGLPLDMGHAVCLDTHACGGGWLTCLETESGMYWQANQKGELRSGRLKQEAAPA